MEAPTDPRQNREQLKAHDDDKALWRTFKPRLVEPLSNLAAICGDALSGVIVEVHTDTLTMKSPYPGFMQGLMAEYGLCIGLMGLPAAPDVSGNDGRIEGIGTGLRNAWHAFAEAMQEEGEELDAIMLWLSMGEIVGMSLLFTTAQTEYFADFDEAVPLPEVEPDAG